MATRKKVIRRKRPVAQRQPKARAKPQRMAQPQQITFTNGELVALNRVTTLLTLAQQTVDAVWNPIREKYGLTREITYDRKTGAVS